MAARAPSLADPSPPAHIVTGLSKIGLVLRHEAWQDRVRTGLTPTQSQILALLRRGPRRLTELADELGVSAATASDSLRVLVEKGLAAKDRSPADGRSLAARLTPAGRGAADRAAEWPDFLLEAVEALDADEQRVFLRALAKMIRSLQEQGRIPVARMCVSCRFFRPHVHRDRTRPHHCAFVDQPFGERELRLDCADQEPLAPDEAKALWDDFTSTPPQKEEA
jgi:DNA-binding MarR family transcriptional regulator